MTHGRTTPSMPPRVVRLDGLPSDALPEPAIQPTTLTGGDWDGDVHRPSYVKGWRWGLIDGAVVGALVAAGGILSGWNWPA